MNQKLISLFLFGVYFSFALAQRIATFDRDRRCSGKIVFQKKPADPDDFGNFLNSTSFSEIDCAVKCYQRVPNCRGVRFDHVSNICMYSSKDQGNCIRIPKDDEVTLENSRMLTMYCIQCIERNTTFVAQTRKIQPFFPLNITTQQIPAENNSQIDKGKIFNPQPVLQSGSQLQQNQILAGVIKNEGQILQPLSANSNSLLNPNSVADSSLKPIAPVAQQNGAPSPSASAPGQGSFPQAPVAGVAQQAAGSLPQVPSVAGSLPQVPAVGGSLPLPQVPAIAGSLPPSSVAAQPQLQLSIAANSSQQLSSPQLPQAASSFPKAAINSSSSPQLPSQSSNFGGPTISDDNSTEVESGDEWIDEVAKPNVTNVDPFSAQPNIAKAAQPLSASLGLNQNQNSAQLAGAPVPSLNNPQPAGILGSAVNNAQLAGFPVPALFSTDTEVSSSSSAQNSSVQQPTVRKINALFPQQNSGDIFANGGNSESNNSSNGNKNETDEPLESTPPPANVQVLHTFNETSGSFSNSGPKDLNVSLPNSSPDNNQTNSIIALQKKPSEISLPNSSPDNNQTSSIIVQQKKPIEPAIPVIKEPQASSSSQISQQGSRITGQLNPVNLSSIVSDASCKEEDLLPCINHIGRDCIVVKPEKCPLCFCPFRSPAKGCSGPSGLNEVIRNELIQGKRNCPNGQPAQTVFRYQRKIDKEKKFDNCVRTIQPYCGLEQDLYWQMPRFVNDCYYYCYTDRELRERNFINITTYD